ncbi:hypothetical protein BUALT_Bualt14G0018500 [Buddleja alternifolia]|uniref:Electron transfer flavoprotein-ubiquinone oxidoreductase, mitochondrial n=1 Tax=Buddleja alternifolia TaxID=168488 RepID=A0AAV6WNP8_9LAMI|nr:hypothetical protein BUALT_Bualt14G0018500 [Buddleja alternifolia]
MLKFISSSSKSKSSSSLISYSIALHFRHLRNLSHNTFDSSSTPTSVNVNNNLYSSRHSTNSTRTAHLGQCRNDFGWIGGVRGFSSERVSRECLNYDVVIVGAGPAGLSAAIRLKQLCKEKDVDLSVCVVEKGAEVGAHILSGNVFEPRALDELLPDWKQEEAPVHVPVSSDKFWLLSKTRAFPFPSPFNNRGNYVISVYGDTILRKPVVSVSQGNVTEFLISKKPVVLPFYVFYHAASGGLNVILSQLVRWLAMKAEELGVEIYPGFAASEILYDTADKVIGIATNDMGMAKDGSKKDTFQPGVELKGQVTLFAEGCRGSLSEQVMKKYNLREKGQGQHQTYALGIKEVWEISADKHQAGSVLHTIGWPLDPKTYGGSFLYHMKDRQVAIGFVVALNYHNPFLNPYEEFQNLLYPWTSECVWEYWGGRGVGGPSVFGRKCREGRWITMKSIACILSGNPFAKKFKHHPAIRPLLEGGTVLEYGARTLNEGGYQSIPYPVFPGGAIIGCSAGFLNVPKIKGSHTAMKSGMLAAESVFRTLHEGSPLETFWDSLRSSWIWKELYNARNYRPAFEYGLLPGLALSALEYYIMKGRSLWTLKHGKPDHKATHEAKLWRPIDYPKPDGVISFDMPTSLYRSNTNHDHDQPAHLRLRDPKVPELVNLPVYAGPESRYCPARVYEYIADEKGELKLQINAQNCLHCKACDIKDPKQNIRWTVPEGGGGPGYTVM